MARALPDISLRQLEYLVAVADAPTWSVAAERVGVSPSALSQGLGELERRIGVSLFEPDGRRRVLRAPLLAFDMAISNADGLRTADDTDMINGSPSRFDWKLVGRQEMIIPYNNYRLEVGDYDELLQPGHLAPARTRYELHRVWVIEATLKPDWRHVYSRRVFYVDEDSWTVVIADQYDKGGKLWRVSLAYLKNFYEMPATLPAAYVFHDLQSGRYHVQGLAKDGREAMTQLPMPSDGQFAPAALSRFIR